MSMTGNYPWVGRGGCMDPGYIFRGAYSGDPPVWFGDVGDDPLHSANLGRFPPPCGTVPHR